MSLCSAGGCIVVSALLIVGAPACSGVASGGNVNQGGQAGDGGETENGGDGGGGAPLSQGGSMGSTGGSMQGGQGGVRDVDVGVAKDGGADSAQPAPVGLVPMFVASGHGARTITSCDDGQTWIANHAYENQNVDHSPNTEKGFVYGNGLFVQLIGWGAGSSAKVSRNGIDWKKASIPRGGGGLAFLSSPTPAFITVGGYGGCSISSDGETWRTCEGPNFGSNLREAGGGGAVVGAGGDIAAQFSFDGGKKWKGGGPCSATGGFGNLGQEGGFAFGNNVFAVVTTDGAWCQTTDAGITWKTGKFSGSAAGKMSFARDRFWAPNGRDVYHSADGLAWVHETFKPATVNIHSMARGDSGTYVGVERSGTSDRFFRSTDGINWTPARGTGGTSLRRVVFGYGLPSTMCPLH